ncbi:MAG: hypothetical protein WAW90_00215 [Minisyncoccia bacterium]
MQMPKIIAWLFLISGIIVMFLFIYSVLTILTVPEYSIDPFTNNGQGKLLIGFFVLIMSLTLFSIGVAGLNRK